MKTSLLNKLSALAGISVLFLAPVSAATLEFPGTTGMGGAPGGLVGTIKPGTPASLALEVGYVNTLLGMAGGASQTIGSNVFATSTYNFTGSITITGALDYPTNPPLTIPAGFQYVLGKFGQDSYVWYLGYETASIPNTLGQGLGLSHWAAFNPNSDFRVPDGGSTLMLLGLGLGLLAIVRRKLA